MDPFILGALVSAILVSIASLFGNLLKQQLSVWLSRSGSRNIQLKIGDKVLEIKDISEQARKDFNLLSSIVSILNAEGEIVGAGFIIAPKLVVSVAHVIEHIGATSESKVNLRFALTGDITEAEVKLLQPEQDIAILELEDSLPNGVQPAPLSTQKFERKGDTFLTFSYTSGFPEGIWAKGKILGEVQKDSGRVLQLSSPQISYGMSGAPIFDDTNQKVVGILTSFFVGNRPGEPRDLAFAIPTEDLQEIYSGS